MLQSFASVAVAVAALGLIVAIMVRIRRRHGVGSAAAGSVYELLNQDKRNALEIIVDQRAEARDPEDKDGDLPQLENPKRPDRR